MQAVSLLELIDLIGHAATLKLVEVYGGERLSLARSPDATGILVNAIGVGAARALGERFRSTAIKVPEAHAMRARHYRNQGMNNAAIAVRLGITQASVGFLLDGN